jgi:hypothetical protein
MDNVTSIMSNVKRQATNVRTSHLTSYFSQRNRQIIVDMALAIV